MDDFFSTQMGIPVHRDSLDIEYAGKKLHLIHGDGLAPADRGYRLLKRVFRNPINIWLYSKLPPDWAFPLAKFVSGSSRDYTTGRDHTFAADYETYAKARIESGCDVVVIAHLHIPICKNIGEGTYINTGDFISHFSYAKLDDEKISLEYLAWSGVSLCCWMDWRVCPRRRKFIFKRSSLSPAGFADPTEMLQATDTDFGIDRVNVQCQTPATGSFTGQKSNTRVSKEINNRVSRLWWSENNSFYCF